MNVKDIARDLGISYNMAYELVHQEIKHMQLGRRIVVMESDYAEWKKRKIDESSSAKAKRV